MILAVNIKKNRKKSKVTKINADKQSNEQLMRYNAMIITPMSKNVFTLPFSFKKDQENQELLPDYNKTIAVNNSQDSIHFSESSLSKLQESSSDDSEDQQNNGATFLYNKNGERVHTEPPASDPESPGEAINADGQTIESLRKQIKEIEKKIAKVQTKLSEAMSQVQDEKSGVELEPTDTNQPAPTLSALQATNASAKSSPEKEGAKNENTQGSEATAVTPNTGVQGNSSPNEASPEEAAPNEASPEEAQTDTSNMDAATKAMINAAIAQTEVEMVATELKSLNTQLLNLNNQLAEAIKEKMGGSNGPPGAAGGTPAMGGV